jgi:hypothetical protein
LGRYFAGAATVVPRARRCLSCFLLLWAVLPCATTLVHRRGRATSVCACPRAGEVVHAFAPPCTRAPTHAFTPSRRPRLSLWLHCLALGTSLTRHRAAMAVATRDVVCTREQRMKVGPLRAFRVPSPPTWPRTLVRRRRPRAPSSPFRHRECRPVIRRGQPSVRDRA